MIKGFSNLNRFVTSLTSTITFWFRFVTTLISTINLLTIDFEYLNYVTSTMGGWSMGGLSVNLVKPWA